MALSPRALARLLSGDDREARAIVARADDLAALLSDARAQGVGGLVVARLRALGVLPASIDERERVRDVEAGLWLDRASLALARATSALEHAGIRVATLKGPALAERLYAEAPQHRLSIDVDLLVDPSDLAAATAALSELGWRRDGGGWDRYLEAHHHALHLAHATQPPIDLHFRASLGIGAPLEAAPLLARSIVHRTNAGALVRVPSPEDELVYLAVHAVAHRMSRLVWIVDAARLVERVAVDFELARARAREARVEGALLLLAEAMRSTFAIAVPLASRALGQRTRLSLASMLTGAIVPSPGALDSALTFAVGALACDRRRDALAFASGKIARFALRVGHFRAKRPRDQGA